VINLRIAAIILAVLCMAFILFMSSRTKEQSLNDSQRFMAFFGILQYAGEAVEGSGGRILLSPFHIAVRKFAHLAVYSVLGMLYFVSFYGYFGKTLKTGIICVILVACFGAADETVQIFSERGASVWDVLIDTIGGVIGVTLTGLAYRIILRTNRLKLFFDRIYDFRAP
jgi:VanZ family protein